MYFYFDELFRNAVNGINATAVPSTMVQLAHTILMVSLLFMVYEAWTRGPDVRMLGIGAVKFLIISLVLLNYGPIFLGVGTMFSQVAEFISTFGPGGKDVFDTWRADVAAYTQASPNFIQKFWPAVSGGIPGILETGLLLIGYLVYAVTYPVFCIFYAFYGSVLYVTAPLVLALYPAFSTTGIARAYLVNLLIFHSWGLIYAILGALMSAIHLGTVAEVLARGDAAGFFAGTGEALLLGLASILMAITIFFIPMMASRIVRGDVGSTMFAVASAGMTVATVLATSAINLAGSVLHGARNVGNDGGPGGGGSGGGPGGGGKGNTAADRSGKEPPTPPPAKSSDGKSREESPKGPQGKEESPKGPAEEQDPKVADSSGDGSKTPKGGKSLETSNPSEPKGTSGGDKSRRDWEQEPRRMPPPATFEPRLYTPMNISQIFLAKVGEQMGKEIGKTVQSVRGDNNKAKK